MTMETRQTCRCRQCNVISQTSPCPNVSYPRPDRQKKPPKNCVDRVKFLVSLSRKVCDAQINNAGTSLVKTNVFFFIHLNSIQCNFIYIMFIAIMRNPEFDLEKQQQWGKVPLTNRRRPGTRIRLSNGGTNTSFTTSLASFRVAPLATLNSSKWNIAFARHADVISKLKQAANRYQKCEN